MIGRSVSARIALWFAAAALGAAVGVLFTPSSAAAVDSCEKDECDQGYLWDSCRQVTIRLGCDQIDFNDCQTYICPPIEQ
jgi:hypothetical protein